MIENRLQYLLEQEEIDCPLCHSKDYREAASTRERGGFNVRAVLCNKCGHIYLNSRPTLSAYKKFYYDSDYRGYFSSPDSAEEKNRKRWEKMHEPEYLEKRKAHGRRLYHRYMHKYLKSDDLVFDFGCGDGMWLAGLKEMCGCRIAGCEADAFYKDYIRKNLGIEISVGLLEEIIEDLRAEYSGKVKLGIISGSMQHMVDPMNCLRVIRDILADDGLLYVCNKDLFNDELDRHKIGLAQYISIDHPHYFHPSSYEFMVKKAGYEIIEFSPDSQVRFKHMEILAGKALNSNTPEPRLKPDKVFNKLRIANIHYRTKSFLQLPAKIKRKIFG